MGVGMPQRAARRCLHPGCPETAAGGYCPTHSQTRVHLVVGPPCSGKSTFVEQRRRRGDLVVDWDLLVGALSGGQRRLAEPALNPYVAAARDAVLARLRQCRAGEQPPTAWVISSRRIDVGLPAEVHVMRTSMGECLERLRADPDGRDAAVIEPVIRRWFTNPER